MTEKLPSVVIVGRPNVGKSTLFNRLTGTRRSIVTDEPGITRDRIYGRGCGTGARSRLSTPAASCRTTRPRCRAKFCAKRRWPLRGDQLLLVVDARAGLTPLDAELARRLRRTGKPLVVAVNKVDTRGRRRWRRRSTNWARMFFRSRRSRLRRRRVARCDDQGFSGHHGRAVARAGGEARNSSGHHRPSQRRKIHAAQSARGRGTFDRLGGTGNDARRRGYARRAAADTASWTRRVSAARQDNLARKN